MRNRSETLGSLGRAPARTSRQPPAPTPTPPEPAPERGVLRRWIHGALFENVGLKFLSMVLAVTVFLLVNTDKDSEITARIGVSYTLPDDRVLVSKQLEDVLVTLKGPWQRMRRFDQREIDRINIDLRNAPNGDIVLRKDMISLPAGVTATHFDPPVIHVAFDRRIEKLVEVTAQIAGQPQHGYQISEVKLAPATIKVHGAEGALGTLSAIRTREVSVEARTENFVAESEVVTPDGVDVVGSPKVLVHVTVDEELVTRKLPGLVVAVRGDGIDPAKWQVSPGQVEITLTGTLLAVEKAKAAIVPFVKLTAADGKSREAEVTLEGLPPGIGVKLSPERVKVTPVKAAPPPAP